MTKTIGHEMRMNTALHKTFGQKNELDINIRDIYAWLFTSFFSILKLQNVHVCHILIGP